MVQTSSLAAMAAASRKNGDVTLTLTVSTARTSPTAVSRGVQGCERAVMS